MGSKATLPTLMGSKATPPPSSVGLETIYLEPETEPHDSALAALNEMAAMASTLEVNEVLQRALALALKVVSIEAGAISVLNEEANELVFRVQQGWRVHDFVARSVRVPSDRGLSGRVVTTGRPVVTGDVSRDRRVEVIEFREEGIQAMALAPMRARGRVLGVLGVMSYTPREFSPNDITVISAIADQIGIALDNARLLEDARCRVEELSTLQATSMEVSSTLDLWTALEIIISSTLALADAAAVELYLYEDESDKLAFATALRQDGDQTPVSGHPLGDGPVAQAARSGKVLVLADLAASELNVGGWRDHGMETLVALPLERAARVLGVLAIAFDAPRSFSDHELRVLSLLANQAAIAVERTRLFASETRRSTQLALINRVARQSTATLNLSAILDTAADAIWRSFAYFNVALFLIDRVTREAVLYSIAGGHAANIQRGYRRAIEEGVVGWVAATGQTLLVNDVSQEPRYLPLALTSDPVSSELAVPIVRGDEVIGVLDIQHLTLGAFDQEDVQAMETLADQLAIAVDNARLYEETRRRVAELAAVQETSLRVVSSLDTESVLDAVTRNALELVGADDVHILLYDVDDGGLTFGAASWRDTPSPVSRAKQADRFAQAVLGSDRSLIINHAREHPYFSSPEAQKAGVEAVAGFPLLGTSGVAGVMSTVYLRPHAFSEDELRVLGLLASQAAVAITNARLYEETRQRLEELTVLHEVALAAASTLALEEIANRAAAAVKQRLGCEHLHLLLLNEERGVLECIGRGAGAEDGLRVGQGLAGWAVEHIAALRVGDVSQDQRYTGKIPDVRSALVVPLTVGGRTIGVIDAASSRRDAFSAGDEHLMTTVARQLAIAIDNARLYQETERRLAEVSALYQLARQMNTSLEIQDVLDSIVQSLKQAIGCRGCSIALLDTVSNVLEIRAAAGIKDKWKRDFKLRLGEGIAGRVALEGQPAYVPNVLEVKGFVFFDPSVRSILIVPLSVQDVVIGTLSVNSDQIEAFSAADERLLTIAASQAAIAIENARLYTRLDQRARNLAEAYAELQEADRLKDEMVQNISHELRTPLTFVKGYVELLLTGEAGSLSDKQAEYLNIVIDKTNAITRLVSDIILLQQAGRAAGKMSSISLVDLARRALRGCAAAAKSAGLTLSPNFPDDLPLVMGDEGRLFQVLDHLLNNAIKFSPKGGQISLVIEDADPMLQVSVSDQGIGIPKDQQGRIFERFYQVDGSTQRRFGGAGLGLAIAKRIVESHNGQIWVESELGEGSTFCFTVPKYRDWGA
ncbi:MAG: hypothetical protein DRI81_00450 [Chloroflexi bacterium]|nr:MAG: hypothetical protein DRI81_00450 [Chloroflexota bacterium]